MSAQARTKDIDLYRIRLNEVLRRFQIVFREYDRQKAERRKKRRDAKTSGN